ncbi:MAG: hypothetical protein HWE30_14985 [Methylocystaceae bacterium]|nr:hypothetical protein [Methylocystaceae bacterium]
MKSILILCAALVLSSCMQGPPRHWQHPKVPSSQWGADHNKCKRQADKYLGTKPAYQSEQNISSYDEKMRLYNVGKKQKELVADCMRRAGYVPMK